MGSLQWPERESNPRHADFQGVSGRSVEICGEPLGAFQQRLTTVPAKWSSTGQNPPGMRSSGTNQVSNQARGSGSLARPEGRSYALVRHRPSRQIRSVPALGQSVSAPPASVADSLRSRYTLERELGGAAWPPSTSPATSSTTGPSRSKCCILNWPPRSARAVPAGNPGHCPPAAPPYPAADRLRRGRRSGLLPDALCGGRVVARPAEARKAAAS